jgi:hypothetical protein
MAGPAAKDPKSNRFATPFTDGRKTLRVLSKAVLLFLAFDFLQAVVLLPSRLERISFLENLVPPMARLTIPTDIETLVWFPLKPLLDAHQVGKPKASDEFRVAVLGASGTYCGTCTPEEAIPGHLSDLGAQVGGKRVVGYNLAVKGVDWLKDLLVMKHACERGVDAVVWLVTAYRAADTPFKKNDFPHSFVTLNRDDLPDLVKQTGVSTWETRRYEAEAGLLNRSIWQTGNRYRDWLTLVGRTLYLSAVPGDPTATKKYDDEPWVGSKPIRKVARFNSKTPGFEEMPNRRWDLIKAGNRLASSCGAKLLLVNEPIYLGSGPNSDVNYNSHMERALYDRFRGVLGNFVQENQIAYLDIWNLLPGEDFTDISLHHNSAGNRKIAQAIAQKLTETRAGG